MEGLEMKEIVENIANGNQKGKIVSANLFLKKGKLWKVMVALATSGTNCAEYITPA